MLIVYLTLFTDIDVGGIVLLSNIITVSGESVLFLLKHVVFWVLFDGIR